MKDKWGWELGEIAFIVLLLGEEMPKTKKLRLDQFCLIFWKKGSARLWVMGSFCFAFIFGFFISIMKFL